jgi:hypothetical protein
MKKNEKKRFTARDPGLDVVMTGPTETKETNCEYHSANGHRDHSFLCMLTERQKNTI